MDYDVDQITGEDGFITIYTDGSYSFSNERSGGAAVVQNHENYKDSLIFSCKSEISFGNDKAEKYGSTYAELLGIHLALRSLPSESKLKICTDNQDAHRFITSPRKAQQKVIEAMGDTATGKLLQNILNAIQEHEKVDWILKSHKEVESYEEFWLTTKAHNTAARESGAKSKKRIPELYGKVTRAEGPPHDSSESMDIIDLEDGSDNSNTDDKDRNGPLPIFD